MDQIVGIVPCKKSRSVIKYQEELKNKIAQWKQEPSTPSTRISIENAELELNDIVFLNQSVGSDSYAYEVVNMITPNRWVVRELDVDGDERDQIYISNPDNELIKVNRSRKSPSIFSVAGNSYCKFHLAKEPWYYRDPDF